MTGKRTTRILLLVLLGLGLMEVRNSATVLLTPQDSRAFPFDRVSKGTWSTVALIRPLDATSTDIAPALRAAQRFVQRDPALYADFQRAGSSFIYPPTAALTLAPVGWVVTAHGAPRATQWMDLVGRLCMLATWLVGLGILRGVAHTWAQWFLLAIVLAAFYPLRWCLVCIQLQSVLTLLLVLAILAYGGRRTALAGVLLGIAACVKPHLGLIVFFGLLRKELRFVVAAFATALVLIGASVIWLGFDPWRVYFRDVMPQVSIGYGLWPNQSINGAAHRWIGHTTFDLVPGSVGVRVATLTATILFSALAVWPRPRTTGTGPNARRARCLDLGIALLAITLASPVAWEHHYAWTVVLYALVAAAMARAPMGAAGMASLALSYVLLGSHWQPVVAAGAGPISLVNSVGFVGAVLLLQVSWRVGAKIKGGPQRRQVTRRRTDEVGGGTKLGDCDA